MTDELRDKLQVGDRVRYIPRHQDGIVRSFNVDGHPFVVYDSPSKGVVDTLAKAKAWTAALTHVDDVMLLSRKGKADE